MLKKRLIGVITVKNGLAVQSFSYKRYLPLGNPVVLVENLDRWGVDEIMLQCIDRSPYGLGPDFSLLEKIGQLGIQTPLIYSGGIRNVYDSMRVVQAGADRVAVDALMHQDNTEVEKISGTLGAQAVIASLPLVYRKNGIRLFDYIKQKTIKLPENILKLLDKGIVSEALLIDVENEGVDDGFNEDLVNLFPESSLPLIAFGGLNDERKMKCLLERGNVAAIALGNFLNYKEHAAQMYKEKLVELSIRTPVYEAKNPL